MPFAVFHTLSPIVPFVASFGLTVSGRVKPKVTGINSATVTVQTLDVVLPFAFVATQYMYSVPSVLGAV